MSESVQRYDVGYYGMCPYKQGYYVAYKDYESLEKEIDMLKALMRLHKIDKCEYCGGDHPKSYGCHEWMLEGKNYLMQEIERFKNNMEIS